MEDIKVLVVGETSVGRKVIIIGNDGNIITDPEIVSKIESKLDELNLLDNNPREPDFSGSLTFGRILIETPPDYYLKDRHKKKGHERPYKYHR